LHQLDKEIGNNRNIDPCRKMEKNPASDIQFPFFQEKHDLCKKNKINKINILVLYSDVYNTWVRKGKISESKLPAKVLRQAE
jgi:hypothetical protein